MEKTKMTKKDYYQAIIIELGIERPDLADFCKHEIELLEKKSSKKRTSKKTQENQLIKEQILEIDFSEAKTLSEIAEELDGDYSTQKLSALMKQLVEAGNFVRTKKDKKVAFEKVAE